MSLAIQPEIWQTFPDLTLFVAVATGIDNRGERPEIRLRLARAQEKLREEWQHPNPQSHPHVAAWREAARASGISGKRYPSSIEALVRRVVTGRPVSPINPLVDLYNAISLERVVPAGGWNLDDLAGTLALCRAEGGEPFRELGSEETETVEAGEVSYRDDEEIVTRHFVWRQSEKGKVTPATTRVFLVSEILGPLGREMAERVRGAFQEGLEEHFGATVESALLSAPVERWGWAG